MNAVPSASLLMTTTAAGAFFMGAKAVEAAPKPEV